MFLAQQMSGAAGVMAISEPIPGAKPLPVPPELAALRAVGGMGQQVCPLSPSVDLHATLNSLTSVL